MKDSIQLGCVSQDSHPKKSVPRDENWDQITPSKFLQGHVAHGMPAPSPEKPEEQEFAFDSARIPTTVVTANGEVQTNQEAQVYVHDLDLFVTVQILNDTLVVLSLGKLCEEHGCSREWASGQKPHLAPVRLLHRNSRTHQEHLQVQQKCEVTIRHQETGAIAQKIKTNSKKRNENEAVGNRLRDLPAWFQEFTKSRRHRSAIDRTHFS